MKTLLILTALLSTLSPAAHAMDLDADNAKVRIALRAGDEDCKLSLREISRFDGITAGKRYLCAQLIDSNTEVSISDLASLVAKDAVTIEYAGNSEASLLKTLRAWQAALIKDVANLANASTYTAELAPWSFRVVARDGDKLSLNLENANSGEIVSATVLMNAVVVTKNK
ncbi:MAG: hypothetical protein EOP11_24235 [Proteobacteria bacterium]|nr:MAG: hypothetical protein EOP11_24235 [Pseudomonadota bacterium]